MTARRAGAIGILMLAPALAPGMAHGQITPPITTDRPRFTSAARVVGADTFQIESGFAVTRNEPVYDVVRPTLTTVTLPNVLLRVGMNRRLELRIGMAGWVRAGADVPGAEQVSTLSNIDVALGYQFAAQDTAGADIAVIAGTGVPIRHVVSGAFDPFAGLAWARALNESAGLAGTFSWALPAAAAERRVRALAGSVAFGHTLGRSWSGFVEGVVRDLDLPRSGVSWVSNIGVLRRFGDDVQVDAWIGRGLNRSAPDWAGGAGFSMRVRR